MERSDTFHAEGVRRLYDVMRRVNSPSDLADVLQAVADGVVEGLGYGVAAISRLEGDDLVMTAVAGDEEARAAILGRRTPSTVVFNEFTQADQWGILRYVPHDRLPIEALQSAWIPDYVPDSAPDAWHPLDALHAPLYSADGRVLGNMSVDLPPGNRIPSQQQRELLEMFVVQAGLAIANAEQREELAEQVRLGQALRQIVVAGSSGDLDQVLTVAARELHAGLAAAQVSLRCFPDTADDRREHAAGHPLPNQREERVEGLRRDLVQLTSQTAPRPLLLDGDDSDWALLPDSGADVAAIMSVRGWARMLVAALGVGRQVLGYVVVMRTAEQPPFNQNELDAVHEASRELGRLVLDTRLRDTERRLVSELREIDRYKGELIATISHELKTPLTSIIGHTELLEDAEVHVTSVRAISRNAARLDRLVTNLLSYSKVQEKRELVRRPVDLEDVCRTSLEMLAVQAAGAGVDVTLCPAPGPVVVNGDPEELPRVVDNICSNAVKYTRPGGSVVVEVRASGGYGEVVVTDTGLGISPGDRGHLFSAFHRSTNPDALTIPGTGLGLAISRRIAELHGGTIEVESELGRGSTFTLRVPLAG